LASNSLKEELLKLPHGPHAAFRDLIAGFSRPREKQNLLLNVRRKEQQTHDLRHAGAGDVASAGDFGELADLAGVYEFLDAMGQRPLAATVVPSPPRLVTPPQPR